MGGTGVGCGGLGGTGYKHVMGPFSVFFQLRLKASQEDTNGDRQAQASYWEMFYSGVI